MPSINPGPSAFTATNTQAPQALSGYSQAGTINGYTVVQGAIPMYMPSNGTFTSVGVLTLATALDQTFTSAYFYFPAGAIGTNSLAGMYFVQMSSTTVGVAYQNPYTSGTPSIPTTLIPCTSAVSYTQTTGSLVNAVTGTIPGGAMGANGKIKVICIYQNNNSVGTKTYSVKFGGSQTVGTTATTNQTLSIIRELYNRGATNIQTSAANGMTGTGAAAGATQVYAKDTTISQDVNIQFQLGTATDWAGVDLFSIEVFPSN